MKVEQKMKTSRVLSNPTNSHVKQAVMTDSGYTLIMKKLDKIEERLQSIEKDLVKLR